jgi:hypothetical protein
MAHNIRQEDGKMELSMKAWLIEQRLFWGFVLFCMLMYWTR